MSRYVVADIGGTSVKCAVMANDDDTSFDIVERYTFKTPNNYDSLIDELRGYIDKCAPQAVQISVPGVHDKAHDTVLLAPNISCLEGKHIIADLGVEPAVFIENDANIAALGEYTRGFAGKRPKSMIILTLGTGVGGGVIYNQKLFTGDVTAAEFGHITLVAEGRRCGCGKRGCVEKYCTLPAIITDYVELSGDNAANNITYVVDKLKTGDKSAVAAFERFSLYLAHTISSLIDIFNPEVVRIGGGVSELQEFFFPATLKFLDELIFVAFRGKVDVGIATLRNDAALYGGAEWIRECLVKDNCKN